jgi:hypothetical protein
MGDRQAGHTAAEASAASSLGPALEPQETSLPPEPAGPQHPEAEIKVEIEAYLAAIATRLASLCLAGPRRARQAIIAELRDGLLQATTANLEQGLRPKQAALAALEEFGGPAARSPPPSPRSWPASTPTAPRSPSPAPAPWSACYGSPPWPPSTHSPCDTG